MPDADDAGNQETIPGTDASPSDATQAPEPVEIRLALVMSGGVSLAVWMGGVTHELDLVRRASRGDPLGTVEKADRPVYQQWQDVLARSHKTVSIDIISGTSAGGLNGLLLATAIARGAALSGLRQMWQSSASLNVLMPPSSPNDSIFDGSRFENQISQALNGITSGLHPDEPVTLFVTSTALDGKNLKFEDGSGRHFDVPDHRRLYRFQNRPCVWSYTADERGRWSFEKQERRQFDPDTAPALELAARATAGFPLAFAPVGELPLVPFRVRPDAAHDKTASCVVDGGVLENAPFGPVLEEITSRQLNAPVERVLVYIVPSAGRPAEEGIKRLPCDEIQPAVVGWDALNYPQEAGFRSAIEDLNRRMQASSRGLREDLFERMADPQLGPDTSANLRSAAARLVGEYRRSRVEAVVRYVLAEPANGQTVTPLSVPIEADAKSIATILAQGYCWYPTADPRVVEAPDSNEPWHWGVVTAERVLQMLGNHLHELLIGARPGAPMLTASERAAVGTGAERISNLLCKVIAVNDAVRAERKTRAGTDPKMGALDAARMVHDVCIDLGVPEEVGNLVKRAAATFLDTLGKAGISVSWTAVDDLVSACLTVEVLTMAFAPPSKAMNKLTPKLTFLRLGPDEMGPLFDEDWSEGLGDRKLYGIHFRHFGAFLSEEWRQSDFAWGRLDAAHHLLPLLLAHDPGSHTETEMALHNAILAAETGQDAATAADQLRKRMRVLGESTDAELLDPDKQRALQEAGDRTINLLIHAGRLTRWAAERIWHHWLKNWAKGKDKGRAR